MSSSVTSLSTGSTNLGVSGLASGFDWQSLISQLIAVERQPETQLQNQQALLQQKNNALGSIKTELSVFQNDLANLKTPAFFDSRTAVSSNTAAATASAASGTALGTYSFVVSQMASAAAMQGTAGAGAALSPTDDVSGLTLSSAGFATPVTAGTFTVNGAQITIGTGDTLKSVFDQISTATGGAVTASYSHANDQITLSATNPIILGSATDTSNFLQAAKLSNNGTNTVTSPARLGSVVLTGPLKDSNLSTAVTGDASGNGAFTVNGVTINYNINSDSIGNLLTRINDSAAGVVANYDAPNNRFTLTNKTTGDTGIAVSDVTGGNFLAATGLSGGSLVRGNNLLYTVNNGPQISSQTNTIASGSSGISGLSVTALANGAFTVNVGADTATIKTAVTNFVTEYNRIQSVISTQTASTTDSTGKVTAGILTGDMQTEALTSRLRDLMTSVASQIGGTLRLDNLGFKSNGQTDALSTTDLSGLDNVLANSLGGLKDLFSNPNGGLGVQMDAFLTGTIGENGSLVAEQTSLTTQSTDFNTQISNIEKQVLNHQAQMTTEFVAMETAQSQANQQMAYLTKAFP